MVITLQHKQFFSVDPTSPIPNSILQYGDNLFATVLNCLMCMTKKSPLKCRVSFAPDKVVCAYTEKSCRAYTQIQLVLFLKFPQFPPNFPIFPLVFPSIFPK